jgi:hypothetical protein
VARSGFVAANETVLIRVSPAISFAPANLVIRASVEPDAFNRAMEVVVDSDEFYRSSSIQLDGDQGPRTTVCEFRSLPPGPAFRRAAAIVQTAKIASRRPALILRSSHRDWGEH